jgi:hypothetical protein
MYINRQEGSVAVVDVHYLVGEGQAIEYFVERHEVGLYTYEEYADAFRQANLHWALLEEPKFFPRGLYLASVNAEGLPKHTGRLGAPGAPLVI